ncbi:hypothetical protein PIB30_099523 [Stylosanthes scabra]|uniref:Uncharacterized protein n=1 Tax=Stylosanthes scabra TaxID=79078 RepID=A0ABU6V0N9_9FABA|nr:hypothetical protein [Stylosanthes scabra]
MAASTALSSGLQKSHTADEDTVIILETSDISSDRDRCSKSLIGRLLADRSFSTEHYKTKELGCKLGSSFGKVLESDIFQVRGKENRIVKAKVLLDITSPLRRYLKISGPNQIKDSLQGEVDEEKWGDWLKSDQGGRRESILKENIPPNLKYAEDVSQSKPNKPVPVNLIKGLASLSVNSQNVQQTLGDKEVTSAVNPSNNSPNNPMLTMPHSGSHVPEGEGNHAAFVFHAGDIGSQISSPRLSLKQQARKKFIKVSGVKRSALTSKEEKIQKKQCSGEGHATEEGEGATLKWAPNAQ